MAAKLIFKFSEGKPPLLRDVTNLLYDLDLAYEFGVLLTEREYRKFKFSQYFWFRKGRPISDEHRLQADRIALQSPLDLGVVAASLGGIWILLQIIERVQNWSMAREKLQLEVEKLRRESAAAHDEMINKYSDDFNELVRRREAGGISNRIVHRLDESDFKLKQLELKLEDRRQGPRGQSK